MNDNEVEVLVYEPEVVGTGKLEVRLQNDTVWLTIEQMSQLFGRDRTVINKHILNATKEGEISEKNKVQILHLIRRGRKEFLYDLDVIISVGYRVKSLQGVTFRRWATKILREHLLRGYSINQELASIKENLSDHERRLANAEMSVRTLTHVLLTPPPAKPEPLRRKIGFKGE